MDAREELAAWPGVDAWTSGEILSHPAWLLSVGYDGADADLTGAAPAGDELFVELEMDGERHVLGLADSESLPDLHRLWARRSELPEALLIALIEKEAGALLQTVENLVRRELRLGGLSPAPAGDRRSFRLASAAASLVFSLDLPDETCVDLGVLGNLDTDHESIRTMRRSARAVYTVVEPPADAPLAQAGDLLVLAALAPAWWVTIPEDGRYYVCAAQEESFTFAQFADRTLPDPPVPDAITVFRCGKPYAMAERHPFGDVRAIRLTKLL